MYICTSSVSAHLTKPFIIYGVAATLIVMLLCSTAVRAFRAWNYRVFYAIHVTAAAIVLPILCFHGRFMRIYLTEAILIYAASSILRTWVTQRVSGTLKTIQTPDSMILDIRIPEVECSQSWHPGQYALISREGNLISRLLGSVPLSIASLANDDKEMRLIARVRNGATRDLANLDRDASYRFNLEGPYGQSDHIAELLRCPKIVLVAGGVGGTFVVPIYRQLLQHMAARSRTHHNLAMHWIASSSADVAWALADRYLQEPGFKENLQIHLTQDRPDGHVSDKPENLPHIDDKSSSPFLEAVKTSPLRPTNVSPCCINLRYGRPDLGQLITSTFAEDVEARTAVVVCGPSSLITNVRRETGIWVCRGYACHWIAEDFES
jgi:NAD(P)H-flavin reductase